LATGKIQKLDKKNPYSRWFLRLCKGIFILIAAKLGRVSAKIQIRRMPLRAAGSADT
jgi:hypothetical protein